jgi:uroporphyrinogen III methyltransferase/synthase
MVYLVGAGPGDSSLITQKGLWCIKNADVIIYDHLANPTLLNNAKDGCSLIYAGKIAGNHHMVQEKINEELVRYGGTLNVVRLKGGDPFIFGRGGEEVIALCENNIPYEIVPGISSCYSAAEYCGIPVTHRGVATSFHVITGHEKSGSETVDYSALARLCGTLVFLMGRSFAENISRKLIENGKSPLTPAAIISNGTTERQEFLTGTLKDIPDMAKKVPSPAVILVGDAVGLQRSWFTPSKAKILATGTKSMTAQIAKAARDIPITEMSLIKTVPINFDLFSKTNLSEFSHIAFTSASGVEIFFDYIKRLHIDIRAFGDTKFASVGKKTALALEERNIFPDIVPQKHCGSELGKLLCKSECKKILLLRAENASDALTDILTEHNVNFTDLKLYRTETDFSKKELLNLCAPEMDYIIFASGSALKAFSQMAEVTTDAKFISIGAETTKAAEKYGINIYKTAASPTAEGIADCINSDRRDTK